MGCIFSRIEKEVCGRYCRIGIGDGSVIKVKYLKGKYFMNNRTLNIGDRGRLVIKNLWYFRRFYILLLEIVMGIGDGSVVKVKGP